MAQNELDLDISKFDTALAEAVAETAKLGREVEKETAVLRLMERQFVKLGAASGITGKQLDAQASVVQDLGVRFKGAQKDQVAFEKLLGVTDKTSRGFIPTLSKIRTAVGLLFSGIALGGLISFTKSIINYGSAIHDTALKTRTSSEAFQRVTFALSKSGVGAEDASSALHGIADAMTEARTGSADAADKLRQLGVSFADIKSKTPDQIFLQIAGSVQKAGNEEESLRRLTALFGADLARILLPALKQGGEALGNMGDQAKVASDGMTDAANDGAKALERWGTSIKQWALEAVNSFNEVKEAREGVARSQAEQQRQNGEEQERTNARERELAAQHYKATGRQQYDSPIGPMQGQYNSPIGPMQPAQPRESAPDMAQRTYLENEQKIAREIAPEYVKQKQKLVNEETRLNSEIGFAIGLEKERLQTQLAQNIEAQRAIDYATELKQSEIELNEFRSTKGRGFQAEQKAFANEIRDLDNQINYAEEHGQDDRAAALKAQRHEIVLSAMANKEAHDDEMYSLRAQTSEMQAHQKGLEGLANQTAIRAKYTNQILAALRAQNTEAAALLQTEQAIELRRANAQEHDITPEQRKRARAADRTESRKARQQEARDAEQDRRGREDTSLNASGDLSRGQREKGLHASGLNGAKSDLIDTARKKHESYKEQQARIAQAKSDNEDWPKHVREIYEILKKGD